MSASNIYGPIVVPDAVEEAVAATLSDFMPDYLGEMERQRGYEPGQIAQPAGIITVSEFAKWNEDQLPLIMIVSPGLADTPLARSGEHEAAWSITVAALVADVDELAARRLAGVYAGAIRAILVQHKRLRSTLHPEGFAQFTSWVGETYSDLPFEDTRTIDSCRVVFNVGVENVVRQNGGPRVPTGVPGKDPGEWPRVIKGGVSVTTTPEPIGA